MIPGSKVVGFLMDTTPSTPPRFPFDYAYLDLIIPKQLLEGEPMAG